MSDLPQSAAIVRIEPRWKVLSVHVPFVAAVSNYAGSPVHLAVDRRLLFGRLSQQKLLGAVPVQEHIIVQFDGELEIVAVVVEVLEKRQSLSKLKRPITA